MRTTNFDAIAAAAPLDRQASVVRDGSGDTYEDKAATHALHFKAPPPPVCVMPPHTTDLSGRVFDRLTVIRFHMTTGAGRAMWLVRCVCGDYEVRRGESLRKSEGKSAVCGICQHVDDLRARASRPNTKAARRASAAMLDKFAKGGAL